MHLLVKVGIASLTVIGNLMRFNVGSIQNRIYCGFMNRGQPCITLCFRCFMDVLCKLSIGPGFCRISEIRRSLASIFYDPGLLFVGYFGISPATGSVIDGVLNPALVLFLKAENDTVSI